MKPGVNKAVMYVSGPRELKKVYVQRRYRGQVIINGLVEECDECAGEIG